MDEPDPRLQGMCMAIQTGNLTNVLAVLEAGLPIDAKLPYDTPLVVATENGHIDIVSLLLDLGAGIDPTSMLEKSALIVAAGNGHMDIVSLLLDRGADIKDRHESTIFGTTGHGSALKTAAGNGHMGIVSLLLDRGADPNATETWNGSSGKSALSAAAENGHRDVTSLLLDRGANINAATRRKSALSAAAKNGHRDIVSLLLDRGADINGAIIRNSALSAAAENGHMDIVSLLLDRGADINTSTTESKSALSGAAEKGYMGIVSLLLDRGADPNATETWNGSSGKSALGAAAEKGHMGIVSLLLDRGADPNATEAWNGSSGKSALSAAAENGHMGIVSLLLDRGADPKATGTWIDSAGKITTSALSAAAENGHMDIVSLLLDRGADIKDHESTILGTICSALSVAARNGHMGIVSLLLDRGSSDVEGAALIAAAHWGHTDVVSLLLDRGSPDEGYALIAATKHGHTDVVSLLLDRGSPDEGAALIAAAELGDKDLMSLLLDRGSPDDGTALIAAAKKGHTDVVSLLLDRGSPDEGAALIAAAEQRHKNLVSRLLDRGSGAAGAALVAAVTKGQHEIVSMLLDLGADINAIATGTRNTYGTALIAAVANHQRGLVAMLLDRGADINAIVPGHHHCTALITNIHMMASQRMWSRWGYDGEVLDLLLDRGADVNIVVEGNPYRTALSTCVGTIEHIPGKIGPMSQLLACGADVNIVTGDSGTALGIAAYRGSEKNVAFLLNHGADIYHVGGKYETANGEYPTALDAARASKTATESILKLLSDAMLISNPGTDSTRCPPFPMPYTGTYKPSITTITDKHIESVSKFHAGSNLTLKQADLSCEALGVEVLIKLLVTLVGITAEAAEQHQLWIRSDARYFISQGYDLGLAYAACRVAWKNFNTQAFNIAGHRGRWLKEAKEIDAARANSIYLNPDTGQELIKSPYEVMPRRIWDVKSNRVVEFRMLHSDALAHGYRNPHNGSMTISPAFWAVTHSWASHMEPVETSINQYQWPVPLPRDLDLDYDLRKELLGFGAEYVWLDVLCLRQHSRYNHIYLETKRAEEWKLDVPTIGNIYRAATALVRYFNGLGRPFRNGGWDDPRHWLRRAWTLQEIRSENTTLNGGISDDGTRAHILNAEGTVDGELTTLRYAIRPVVKLAAEVDSLTGCSVYDLAREMAKRFATQPTDKVAGLLYLLRTIHLPTYDERITDEDAWRQCVHVLPLARKIEILCDFPYRGDEDQWFPTWGQLLEWPQRDLRYIHVRSVCPESHNHLDLVTQESGALEGQSPLFVPDIWVLPGIKLAQTSQPNQYEIKIQNKLFGFYCPYLQQTPFELHASFTLATPSLGHSNNWVVCESRGTRRMKRKSTDRKKTTISIEALALRKIGVLATDSSSELYIHAGTSRSMLKKISCVFE